MTETSTVAPYPTPVPNGIIESFRYAFSSVIMSIAIALAGGRPAVSDMGEMPEPPPKLFIPNVPLNFETLQIIAPYALAVAVVGIMESLMTAKPVDDITDTHSDKSRESWGQGVANIVSGFFGGMGGCALIGQTMINVRESQARRAE